MQKSLAKTYFPLALKVASQIETIISVKKFFEAELSLTSRVRAVFSQVEPFLKSPILTMPLLVEYKKRLLLTGWNLAEVITSEISSRFSGFKSTTL